MRMKNLFRLLPVIRHVPPRALILRLRREMRQRGLTRSADPFGRLGVAPSNEYRSAVGLLQSGFRNFAETIRILTASAFRYDRDRNALIFALSGDVASVADVDAVPWTTQDNIPASDVNRCFFLSFVEQASLLDGDPGEDLALLDDHVTRLVRAAPLGGRRLTIPWQALSVARRLINLTAGLASILGRNPNLSDRPEIARLLTHVVLLRAVLERIREDDLGYNHLASEVFAQCVADRLFGDEAALRAHAREFVATMKVQVGSDGLQLERSATYQCHLLGHLDALIAGRILPDPQHGEIVRLAAKMRPALAMMTHRDGGIAVFNDAAVGDGPSPEVLGATGSTWPSGIYKLEEAGYARLEHGPFSALFDAGPCGADDNPGHAHADFLAFELDVGAARFVVDPGVATYKGGAERDACRSSAAHNGPTFAGLEPIEFVGAFRIGRRGRGRFLHEREAAALLHLAPGVGGTHDGFDRFGGRVARWIAQLSEGILIVDAWKGLVGSEARSTFLVDAREWWVDSVEEAQVVLRSREGVCVVVTAIRGRLQIEEGGKFNLFGPKSTLPAIRMVAVPQEAGGDLRRLALSVYQCSPPTIDRVLVDRVSELLMATLSR